MVRCILFLFFYFILLSLTTLHVRAAISEDLVVETELGPIKGLKAEDGNYTMFLGIPFAKINKSNIFGESIPQGPFDAVFEAFTDSARCPQVEEFNSTAVGTLNCLQLNVYVPDSASSQNVLPVMVYIFGGGFSIGFADRYMYGPKYIVREDVILVTINYRLGPYGFMCLHTPEIPGNAGLKDQLTGLRWVQNHIESFGGDPNQITVFGNSAGAMSIGMHIASENEKLFDNAIFQSGSVFSNTIVSAYDNSDIVLRLANALNISTNDVSEAVSALSSVDILDVVQVVSEIGVNFAMCIEKEFPGVERLLARHPLHSNHSKANGMAIMVGYTTDELISIFGNEEVDMNGFDQVFSNYISNNFNFNDTLQLRLSNMVRRFYLGDAEINNDVRQYIANFMDDSTFVYSIIRSIEPYLNAGAEKIYQFLFAYDGTRNFVKHKDNITVPGVAHADEVGYLFDMAMLPNPTVEDQLIIDRMTAMWTNFAKYRDPTPEPTTLLPVTWQPIVNTSAYHYLEINTAMSSEMRYEHRRMTFWDLFHEAYGEYEISNNVLASSATLFSFYFVILVIGLTANFIL